MAGEPAEREASYEDLLALPRDVTGQILFGVLHAHPRPAPRHALASTRSGLVVVGTYSEQVSAVKKRPEWERLMKDAHRGKMDFVLCFALDRVGRSMAGNVQALLDLDARGVRAISVAEPWLDTNGPVRELLIAIMSWVAQQERTRMIERVKLGMDRARREGTHLGRPRADFDPRRAFELRRDGLSYRAIA